MFGFLRRDESRLYRYAIVPSPQKKKSKCSGGNKNQKEPNNLCFNAVLLPRENDGTSNRYHHAPKCREKGSVCTEVKKVKQSPPFIN